MTTAARPIRVLHICTIPLTALIFVAPLARYQRERGYDVAVACSTAATHDGPGLPPGQDLVGCPVYPVAIPRKPWPLAALRAVWQTYRLVRRLRPDIVHTQTSQAGAVGRLAARLAGVPIVIHTAHAFPFHRRPRWAFAAIERWEERFTDVIMVDTESAGAEGLRYRFVRDPSKLVTVPMGIDLKKFSPSTQGPDNLRKELGFQPRDLIVGTVARLVEDKGLECFLQMAKRIRAARPDVRFLVVGDGELRGKLERLAEKLGIRAAVVFTGHRTDVPALMEAMDLFVLPTLHEGFGVVFAEAMAMGRAVVGSWIKPVAEVVEDGVTGYLALPEDVEEFARRALELLGDGGKRRAFGEAGRRRVEKLFTEERMCETIERQYRHLLESKECLT